MSETQPCLILTEGIFNVLAPAVDRNALYTHQGFCDAIDAWNTEYPTNPIFDGPGEEYQRYELAAFFGNVLHETGDLRFVREQSQCGDFFQDPGSGTIYCQPDGYSTSGTNPPYGAYCTSQYNTTTDPDGCTCSVVVEMTDASLGIGYNSADMFYGRGAIQLSWNYNYIDASNALSYLHPTEDEPGNVLCENPDLVATNETYAWGAAIWFWMTQGTPTSHEAIFTYSFGGTVDAINGGLECNSTAPDDVLESRITAYCEVSNRLEVPLLDLDSCAGLQEAFEVCAGVSGEEQCSSNECQQVSTFPPSKSPTRMPTSSPSTTPTASPSKSPTLGPTTSPTTSSPPTNSPTMKPTNAPTIKLIPGCYPKYKSGQHYGDGDWVSATTSVTTETTVPCDYYLEFGCPNTGWKTESTTTTSTHNFQCTSMFWCDNVGYAPDGIYSELAWDKEAEPCSGTAVPKQEPIPDPWSGGGCPAKFSDSEEYGGGDVVTVCSPNKDYCMVYRCKPDLPAPGKFCDMPGYEPGLSLYWEVAWDVEGSCSGTISPSSLPAMDPASFLGGCPATFSSSKEYGGGDTVSVCSSDSKYCTVYKCKPDLPAVGKFCDMTGYEPESSLYWEVAWDVEGYCSGSIEPTSSPSFDPVKFVGGCPAPYSRGANYEDSDRVSKGNLVFECKPWPYSEWCRLDGYEPGVPGIATPDAWTYAWTYIGHCSGTIEMDATAETAPDGKNLGVCGATPTYSLGTDYGPGDLAIVCTSDDWCTVYRCFSDMPIPSRWCSQEGYQPGSGSAWFTAWSEEGYCTTTAAPTSSPSADALPTSSPTVEVLPS